MYEPRMNICFISPCDLYANNGGRTHTIELALNWQKFGHRCFLFFPGWARIDALEGVRQIRVPFIPVKGLHGISFSLLSLIFILYHIKYKFDVIYERKTLISFSVLAGKLLGIPVVFEFNDIPTSFGVSNLLREEKVFWRRLLLRAVSPIFKLDAKLTARLCTKVATTARLELPLIDKGKISEIPFGANTTLFFPMNKVECRRMVGCPETGRIICFVGSFLPWQGIEYLVEAMPAVIQEIPDVILTLVGDCEEKMALSRELKEKLVRLANGPNLRGKIMFAGRVPYEKVPVYINASDVCIVAQSPSRSGYSPLKLFEYMACGKPVVASAIEGVKELIGESRAGVLVPPESAERLAGVLIELLRDDVRRREMGENGLRYIQKYTWENMALKALQVCEKAAGRGSKQ